MECRKWCDRTITGCLANTIDHAASEVHAIRGEGSVHRVDHLLCLCPLGDGLSGCLTAREFRFVRAF